MIEIPLTSEPSQTLSLNIDDVVYDFRVIYNTRSLNWTIGVIVDNVEILSGITMVGGSDILQQYPEIAIKNMYAVNVVDGTLDANLNNLGKDIKLVILTAEELANVQSI